MAKERILFWKTQSESWDVVRSIINYLLGKKTPLLYIFLIISYSVLAYTALIFGLISVLSNSLKITEYFAVISQEQLILFILILNIIAFLLGFVARLIVVNLMVDFEKVTAYRIIQEIKPIQDSLSKSDKNKVMQLLLKDSRFGGRLVGDVCLLLNPIIVFIVSMSILIYIDYVIALSALFIICFNIVIQYFVLIFGNEIMDDMEEKAQGDKQLRWSIIEDQIPPISLENSDFLPVYKKRLLIPHVTNVITGVSFVLFLTWFYFYYINNGVLQSESIVVAFYLCVLLFTSTKQIAKIFTNIGLFFRYYRRTVNIAKRSLKSTSQNNSDFMLDD